jgi:hypothetical protein
VVSRLSQFGKVIYLLGGLVFALVVTMAKTQHGRRKLWCSCPGVRGAYWDHYLRSSVDPSPLNPQSC